MEARNRKIEDWYGKIERGEIKLPRFQRWEAWEWRRISSLVNTITQNLPLGITLILEVGEKELFVSRYLSTAPQTQGRVFEHLLDGQQRLTALWRVLNNNYKWETYYIYLPELDTRPEREAEEQFVYCRGRYLKENGQRYPRWCDDPEDCLKRGMIPTSLLRPTDIQQEINDWLTTATVYRKPADPDQFEEFFNWKKSISDRINELRSIVKNYNLPYLSLSTTTTKDTALDVFINMNTNSKPLSTYDIIVAEVESVKDKSLHDLQKELDDRHPDIKHYFDLSYLILNTSALLQDKLPNQKGLWDMDKAVMVDNWAKMESGLNQMARFLLTEGIIDRDRLPSNAVLSVIAALYPNIPDKGDERGACEILLKKYLWSAFFTNRYENSAATSAYYDYLALKRIFNKEKKKDNTLYAEQDVPIFNRNNYPLADVDELMSAPWPKRDTIRGKGIMAISCLLGAADFATGQKIDRSNIGQRHYHHIFPDALLKEAGIEGSVALNCALIIDNTNFTIGRKEPLKYLKERYKWASEEIVHDRLNAHLIPVEELANGGYEHITDTNQRNEKIKKDFDSFLKKRAGFFTTAVSLLVDGRNLSANEIINNA